MGIHVLIIPKNRGQEKKNVTLVSRPLRVGGKFRRDSIPFGIDIRARKFWEDSLGVIAKRIERYCEL
jgi:hypothetical protein